MSIQEQIREQYNKFWDQSFDLLTKNEAELDHMIDNPLDDRRGLSLIFRPTSQINGEIQNFLNQLSEIEPNQYYYPVEDVHVTVSSIIATRSGYTYNKKDLPKYCEVILKTLSETESFNVSFKGVTTSKAGIMIQGFPDSEDLQLLRTNLKRNLAGAGLDQNIDSRYKLTVCHSTVVRFKAKFQDTEIFSKLIRDYKDCDFGSMNVKNFEFVFNDWYQRKDWSQTIQSYQLPIAS